LLKFFGGPGLQGVKSATLALLLLAGGEDYEDFNPLLQGNR
jgi:hypothetical protein